MFPSYKNQSVDQVDQILHKFFKLFFFLILCSAVCSHKSYLFIHSVIGNTIKWHKKNSKSEKEINGLVCKRLQKYKMDLWFWWRRSKWPRSISCNGHSICQYKRKVKPLKCYVCNVFISCRYVNKSWVYTTPSLKRNQYFP